jgi:quinol monooxygenase YgiN
MDEGSAPQVMEISRFTVRPEASSELIARWPSLVAGLRDNFPGFVSAQLARLDTSNWVFIGYWHSEQACRTAMKVAPSVGAIADWLSLMDREISLEFASIVSP